MLTRWRASQYTVLVALFALFYPRLPKSVQGLDSGELVASAYGLFVPHPPGYPLYVWLMHPLIAIAPGETVFFSAALVTCLFMLAAFAFLLASAESYFAAALVAMLATIPFIWRYAEIPDVFALHALLTASILFVYLKLAPSPRRTLAICVLFGLSAANHQTTLFLAPLVIHALVESKSRDRALASAAIGALVTVVLYASLALLHPASLLSWGDLTNAQNLIGHFLRSEYGTFQLHGGAESASFAQTLSHYLEGAGLFVAISLALIAWKTRAQKELIVVGCALLYIAAFFAAMNLPADLPFDAIRERFFILPTLMLAFVAIRAKLGARLQAAVAAAFVVGAIAQISAGLERQDLRKSVVLQQYGQNLLAEALQTGKPTFLIVEGDSRLSPLQYLLATSPTPYDVVALATGNLFSPAAFAKIKQRWPAFQIPAEDRRDIFEDFVRPNLANFAFIHTLPLNPKGFRTTYLPLGRRLTEGDGEEFRTIEAPTIAPAPASSRDAAEFDVEKKLLDDYAVYHLASGKKAYATGNQAAALKAFERGLALVPTCAPCCSNAKTLREKLQLPALDCR